MSLKLVEQIEFEHSRLQQLLIESRELIESSRPNPPSTTNRWALGAILHAFYNGVENILKRIASTYDNKTDNTGKWHVDLLTQMAGTTTKRSAVISPELLVLLKKYLAFRHLFRSIYTHELLWEPMKELVFNLDDTLRLFVVETTAFCDKIRQG